MQARLVVLDGELKGQIIPLNDGPLVIGRSDDADIVIDEPSVSQKHATIILRDEELHVRDLGSRNGIRHRQRHVQETVVQDQEFFAIGDVYLRLESGQELLAVIREFQHHVEQAKDEISRTIIGQEAVIHQLITTLFAGGHCLLIGVPGLAKTALVNTLGHVLDIRFKRVQFTPDLMPSDITGTTMLSLDGEQKQLKFVHGPIFTQLLLADEINRTPPKTQAALLEAMQEHQVTVGNESRTLPEPFMVVATQNPIEQEGTYPLPEAQLDRFMFSVKVDYPTLANEEEILRRTTRKESVPLRKAMSSHSILRFQRAVQRVEVSPYVIAFVTQLVRCTRPGEVGASAHATEHLEWGAGPRAGQYLIWGGKAMAAMDGRLAVSCDDIRACALPVLRHRLSPNFQAQANGITTDDIVHTLLSEVREPDIQQFDT